MSTQISNSSIHQNQQIEKNQNQSLINNNKKQNQQVNIVQSKSQNQKPKNMNIFGSQTKKINIFSQNSKDQQKKNIFATQNKSINLFNISKLPQPSNPAIFNSKSKALVRKDQDDDEKSITGSSSKASSASLKNSQIQFKNIPQRIQMKFNYQNPWTTLKTFKVRKFRNGLTPTKQHIYLTLQKHTDKPDTTFLMVRSENTKVILFQGMLHNEISQKIQNFMNKQENIKINLLKVKKQEESLTQETQQVKEKSQNNMHKIVRQELKIQFFDKTEADTFKKTVEELLKDQQNKDVTI